MAIWTYEESKSAALAQSLGDQCCLKVCPFCDSPLNRLAGSDFSSFPGPASRYKGMNSDASTLQACSICGWWAASLLTGRAPYIEYDAGNLSLYRACGTLRELDLCDMSTPVKELRSYLLAKYSDRFKIHPKRYEDIVGSVFSDFGFRVRVTSYGGDEGIDVYVFDGQGDVTVGIQVKRQQGKVTAEQIRSFVGALVLQGLTTGIYVTTSSYQKGAERTAWAAQTIPGVAISLVDAMRFYDALKLTQHPDHLEPDNPESPFFERWREMSNPFLDPNSHVAPLVFSTGW